MQDIKESKIKYLHVLNVNEQKFSLRIVDQVKCDKYFNEDEWGYVTPHKKLYDALIEYGAKNVFLEENSKTIIDDYAPYADILFLHAWDIDLSILKVKNSSLKKCVWRTWGHDVYPFVKKKGFSLGILKHNVMAYIRRRKAKNFKVIGIANVIDEIKIKSVFGEKTTVLNYFYTAVDGASMPELPVQRGGRKRILIGHSMYHSEHHLDVLEKLKVFAKEDVLITFISVYGIGRYGEKVLNRAKEIFGDKVENITERQPLDKYLQFLNTVDVAILSDKASSALGTLLWLANLKKKVYVYGDGDLAKGFNHVGCKVNKIEDIKNQTFEEFVSYDEGTAEKMKEKFGKMSTMDECCEKVLTIIAQMTK